MDELAIKPAVSKAEIYSIFVMLKAFFPYLEYSSVDLEKQAKEDVGGHFYFIARLNGNSIGFLHVKIEKSAAEENLLKLCGLGIIPEFQNKGFGKKLVEKAIDFAREKNLQKIYLFVHPANLSAKKLYEKTGFKQVDAQGKEISGQKVEKWEKILR